MRPLVNLAGKRCGPWRVLERASAGSWHVEHVEGGRRTVVIESVLLRFGVRREEPSPTATSSPTTPAPRRLSPSKAARRERRLKTEEQRRQKRVAEARKREDREAERLAKAEERRAANLRAKKAELALRMEKRAVALARREPELPPVQEPPPGWEAEVAGPFRAERALGVS